MMVQVMIIIGRQIFQFFRYVDTHAIIRSDTKLMNDMIAM